ncbi:hypothetical protein Q9Q95_07065 [Sphingomonas sp. DG1-23]|nr:hypothetical protein [Sphingomonas sp. DG1-23]MDP5278679.1 hypothetical protein [Sphingomonas sp. DG1-23]
MLPQSVNEQIESLAEAVTVRLAGGGRQVKLEASTPPAAAQRVGSRNRRMRQHKGAIAEEHRLGADADADRQPRTELNGGKCVVGAGDSGLRHRRGTTIVAVERGKRTHLQSG